MLSRGACFVLLVILPLVSRAQIRTGCEDFSFPFYPPLCFSGGSNFEGFPAIPEHIVESNGHVTMPGNAHVGMWGNILIADTANNRIIEVNPQQVLYPEGDDDILLNAETTDFPVITLQIGYSQFTASGIVPSPPLSSGLWAPNPAPCNYNQDHSVNGPVWATWLMSEAWRIAGGHGGLLLAVVAGFDGCPDNRVRIFYIDFASCYQHDDYGGNQGLLEDYGFKRANCSRGLWSFGSRLPGKDLYSLDHPTHAMQLSFNNYFNQQNHNDDSDSTVFDYSYFLFDDNEEIGLARACIDETDGDGTSLRYSDIMITDQGNNRILRVTFCTQQVLWSYGPARGPAALNAPTMTQQLMGGDIMIADPNNHRIVRITSAGQFVSNLILTPGSRPIMFGMIEQLSGTGCGCNIKGYNCHACLSDLFDYEAGSNPDYEFCDHNYCYVRNIDFDKEMGSYVVVDATNNTLVQYNASGHVEFVYNPNFGEVVSAVRIMRSGFYLITDRKKHTVTVWDRVKHRVIWKYGDLNLPSSAVMVGEETGMTRSNFWTSFLKWFYDEF